MNKNTLVETKEQKIRLQNRFLDYQSVNCPTDWKIIWDNYSSCLLKTNMVLEDDTLFGNEGGFSTCYDTENLRKYFKL